MKFEKNKMKTVIFLLQLITQRRDKKVEPDIFARLTEPL